jgi:hypothetical protein
MDYMPLAMVCPEPIASTLEPPSRQIGVASPRRIVFVGFLIIAHWLAAILAGG